MGDIGDMADMAIIHANGRKSKFRKSVNCLSYCNFNRVLPFELEFGHVEFSLYTVCAPMLFPLPSVFVLTLSVRPGRMPYFFRWHISQ